MYESLILAAGYGSRLRPLTDSTPKPLVPFFGCPLLWSSITRMVNESTGQIFINGHHLADQVKSFIKALPSQYQKRIKFQHESEILGTGGPIARAHEHCQSEDLLIYNSDCLHVIKLDELYRFHKAGAFHATMVLLSECPPGKNPVYAHQGKVVKIGLDDALERNPEISRHTLAGVHIVDRSFRESIPSRCFFDVRDTYNAFIESSEGVGAYVYDGPWFDVGAPLDYWKAHELILSSHNGHDFLTSCGVFEYLRLRGLQSEMQIGDQRPRYFSLVAPSTTPGDLTINLTSAQFDLSKVEKVLLLPEQSFRAFQNNRIYGSGFEMCI